MKITRTSFGPTLARSFVRMVMIALYLTLAFGAGSLFGADGEAARTAANTDAAGVLAGCALMMLAIGTAVARWFREDPV
jgi:hypothetical protein